MKIGDCNQTHAKPFEADDLPHQRVGDLGRGFDGDENARRGLVGRGCCCVAILRHDL